MKPTEKEEQTFRDLVRRQCHERRSRMAKLNGLPKDVRDLLELADEQTGPDGEIYGYRD